jgi:hypothetical protein
LARAGLYDAVASGELGHDDVEAAVVWVSAVSAGGEACLERAVLDQARDGLIAHEGAAGLLYQGEP